MGGTVWRSQAVDMDFSDSAGSDNMQIVPEPTTLLSFGAALVAVTRHRRT